MKDHDKNKKSLYLKYWYVINVESSNKDSYEGYFLEVILNIQKDWINFIMIYHFYQKE